jgi:hypothetical protein
VSANNTKTVTEAPKTAGLSGYLDTTVTSSSTVKETKLGSVHDNQSKEFFNHWQENDRIGILVDQDDHSLSVFRNGDYIATPFNNVNFIFIIFHILFF